ncbi:MAG TPA: DNA polymerase IV [bacterium]|jgi:nucleotidyltransferase/DNA polymerase involved in DNA repair|nr:DNA polymerase IV [bacterium]HOX86155.1 DNA polymerase IV [bacterium]HPG45631.1 DNA polymerase IV [bacterium]HPM97590.1 DNA polymerase IV [bacterium]
MQRVVLHIDMDAFFAAVEQLDHPEMRGKPVVVGADPKGGQGRGVVSTCSYEARRFGIHSAMPISRAWKLCPTAIYVRPRGERYSQVSHQIMKIFLSFTPQVEPVSIDEAFLDITLTAKFFGTAENTAKLLKERIKRETGLTASVGVASSKFIAKIASDLKKPDGLVVVEAGCEKEFLAPLEISRLWGVGPKTVPVMNRHGIFKIGDLAGKKPDQVMHWLGEHGLHFWRLANGIDDRVVEERSEAKSMSKEVTFASDLSDQQELLATLRSLCDELAHDLRQQHYRGRTVGLKIRLADFSTFTRSHTLSHAVVNSNEIYSTASELLHEFDRREQAVRLIGVAVSHFDDPQAQLDLFSDDSAAVDPIDRLMDNVKKKFGDQAIRRASAGSKPRRSSD